MSEYAIQFRNVKKAYGDVKVLNNFSLNIEKNSFVTIIGRSGCGKTTALKLINALIAPDDGHIFVEGTDITNINPIELRRKLGYAIQGIGLFPHMTVGQNIAYVPNLSKLWNKAEQKEQVAQRLEKVGLDAQLAKRYPRELSGGQRQRVGVARALAADPAIVLMDEPFGAVDGITRKALQEELLKLHKTRDMTIVFVTHDISEAINLGTHLLVMEKGEVVQYDSPQNIVANPKNEFVANLVKAD